MLTKLLSGCLRAFKHLLRGCGWSPMLSLWRYFLTRSSDKCFCPHGWLSRLHISEAQKLWSELWTDHITHLPGGCRVLWNAVFNGFCFCFHFIILCYEILAKQSLHGLHFFFFFFFCSFCSGLAHLPVYIFHPVQA